MKVKVLNATLKSYWYSDSISEEFDVEYYNICDRENPYKQSGMPRYFRNHDVVITELPESFCVKRCDNGIKWRKYIDWLNKKSGNILNGFSCKYYGVHKTTVCGNGGGYFGTEIHIDDMIKHIDYMESQLTVKEEDKEYDLTTDEGRLAYAKKHYPIGCTVIEVSGEKFKSKVKEIHTSVNNSIKLQFGAGLLYNNITGEWAEIIKEETIMETQKLSRQGLKEIHSVACSAWKQTLEQYGSRNPLEDYIELTQEEVNQMFDACEYNQLPIVSKYLKQDDGSVDVTKFNVSGKGFCDDNFYIIRDREMGKYKKQSFLLSERYNWEIKTDELGQLCLIPTKKK